MKRQNLESEGKGLREKNELSVVQKRLLTFCLLLMSPTIVWINSDWSRNVATLASSSAINLHAVNNVCCCCSLGGGGGFLDQYSRSLSAPFSSPSPPPLLHLSLQAGKQPYCASPLSLLDIFP